MQSGVEYFFHPVLQLGETTDLLGDIFNYSAGTAVVSGLPSTAGLDFWFREGIVVPEPASGAFLLVGALAILIASKRQRT